MNPVNKITSERQQKKGKHQQPKVQDCAPYEKVGQGLDIHGEYPFYRSCRFRFN
jgi:hypothetical protein